MNVLLVVAHPRPDSLTHVVAQEFARALVTRGHVPEVADLYREGFDPVLMPSDEPDWADPDKVYSPAVRTEMARVERNHATVLVFPVWWWSMPAMLKGWVDRVWNHGWAYGNRNYPHARVWMLGVAGVTEEAYHARGTDAAMRTSLEGAILGYCGVAEPRLALLYGALEGPEPVATILKRAGELGAEF